jgi:hypothetical protein
MARINLTANAAEESGSYEPVPEGEYVLTVLKVTDKVTSTGRDMVNLEMAIDEGPYRGRKVWSNVTFIPAGEAGHGLMVQALKAFGLPFDGELDFDTSDFEGRTCRAKLVIEPYTDTKTGKQKMKNAIPTAGFITDKSDAPAPKSAAAAHPATRAAAAGLTGKTTVKPKEEVPF